MRTSPTKNTKMMKDEINENSEKFNPSIHEAQRSLAEIGGMTSARVLPSNVDTGTIS